MTYIINIYKFVLLLLIFFMLNIIVYNILFSNTNIIEGLKIKKITKTVSKSASSAVNKATGEVENAAQAAKAEAERVARETAERAAAAKAEAERIAREAAAEAERIAREAAELIAINKAIGYLFNSITSLGSSFNNIIKSLDF